jgi:spore germination protein KC
MNELSITLGMGIDKGDKGYKVSVQVVQPGEVAAKKEGQGAPVTLYQAEGATIFEAIRKMTTDSPRKIYAAHLRIVVISEDMAREGITQVLDLLSRDYELRTNFYLLVAKGTTAENTLRILTPLEKNPANKLFQSTETSEKVWAPTRAITLDEFITDFVSDGKHPVISGIEVIGDIKKGQSLENIKEIRPETLLKIDGLAVFKKDKLIGWLNEEQSKVYNYITDNVKSTVGHITCPQGGLVTLEVFHSKSEIKGSVQNRIPRIDLELNIEQNVGEVQCKIDLTKAATIQELEQISQQKLQTMLQNTIQTVQKKYKVDIFGFGEAIHRSNPQAWKSLKADWDDDFTDLKVHVKVNVKIKRLGTVTDSFYQKAKE